MWVTVDVVVAAGDQQEQVKTRVEWQTMLGRNGSGKTWAKQGSLYVRE